MAHTAFDTVVKYGVSSPDTEVVDLYSVEFPTNQIGKVQTTHLQSTNQTRTYIKGWKDSGEMKCMSRYTGTNLITISGLEGDDLKWKVIFSDGESASFDGYVNSVKITDIGIEDSAMGIEFVVQLTSQVTFAAGT